MDSAQHISDSLSLAHEMGRLDFVTALLAAITIALLLGGVVAFFDVRRSAKRISKQVAETEARAIAEKTAVAYLEKELPNYQELARNAVGGVEANKIAQAQDHGSFSATGHDADLSVDRHDPVWAIINRYRKKAPVDVHGIASSLGIRIHEAFLPENVSGIIERTKDGNFVITVNTFDSDTRKRFTIAHELGHFMLHRSMIGDGIEDDRAYRSTTSGKYRNNLIGPREESQANAFAANVIMPYELIQRL